MTGAWEPISCSKQYTPQFLANVFAAARERAAQVIARDCQVCSGGLVVPTGVEYLGATEYGGCSDCYGLAAQIVQVVLHPKEDT